MQHYIINSDKFPSAYIFLSDKESNIWEFIMYNNWKCFAGMESNS